MARSFRHVPIHGHCGTSEKFDKAHSHRATRMRVRVCLHATTDESLDSLVLPLAREVKSIWSFLKDGKGYQLDHELEIPGYKVRLRSHEGRLVLVTINSDCNVVKMIRK